MKTKRQRAFNVRIMGKKAYTIGGDSAGRFYSNGTTNHKPRKSVRNRQRRVKLSRLWSLCKWIFWITVITYFLSTIQISYKPFNDVKAEEVSLPLNGATSFESADMPRDVETREYTRSRDDVKLMIKEVFGKDSDNAIKIADCESDFVYNKHNYNVKTGDDSWGIFQVNRYGKLALTRPSAENLIDPMFNIKYAKQLFDSAGGFSRDWRVCSRLNKIK